MILEHPPQCICTLAAASGHGGGTEARDGPAEGEDHKARVGTRGEVSRRW